MSLRVGLVSVAHGHVGSYAHNLGINPRTEIAGVWDDDSERGRTFAEQNGLTFFDRLDDLLAVCDAVTICSENNKHADHVERCAAAGKHILCEKPLAAKAGDVDRIRTAVSASSIKFMTAFPCRFSPAWQALKSRVKGGELGQIQAINATNRGTCPWSWFVQPEHSGGGAMIDHVVHVADLLRDLLGEEPSSVYAQIGNNMYGQEWDDTAMVSLEYPGGVFATLDSSWSRPPSFKTWGDVTMKIVGDKGVLNLDMFGQGIGHYRNEKNPTYALQAYGSDLDGAMVEAFVSSVLDEALIVVTLEDGLAAASVSLRAYEAVRRKEAIGI